MTAQHGCLDPPGSPSPPVVQRQNTTGCHRSIAHLATSGAAISKRLAADEEGLDRQTEILMSIRSVSCVTTAGR